MLSKGSIVGITIGVLFTASIVIVISLLFAGEFDDNTNLPCPPGGSLTLITDPKPDTYYDDEGNEIEYTASIQTYIFTPPPDPTYTYKGCS